MNAKTLKLIHFSPLFSVAAVFILSLATKTASAMSTAAARHYNTDFTVDDITKPLIDFFKSVLNILLSPFTAIKVVFDTWSHNLYSTLGVFAPLVAVVIVVLSLFVIYLAYTLKDYLPI